VDDLGTGTIAGGGTTALDTAAQDKTAFDAIAARSGGSGVSLGDILKVASVAIPAAGLIAGSAGAFNGGGGGTAPGSSTTVSGQNPEQEALLALLANEQFPAREGGFYNVVNQLVARANASPEMLGQLVDPQLQKMAQQILEATKGVSKTFGPFGGKQTPAALGAVRGAQPMLDTYLGPQQKARSTFGDFVGGTSLIAPSGSVSTKTTNPVSDPNAYAKGVEGLTDLVKNFQKASDGSNPFSGVTDWIGNLFKSNPTATANQPTQYGGFDQPSAYDFGLE
jgi:hypothetical protein